MSILVEYISKLDTKLINEEKLIMLHIKAESKSIQKNSIDKYHSILFRNIKTIRGYKSRYYKYNSDTSRAFPYGTSILGVCAIMYYHNDENLARVESKIICNHPQSLLVSEAIIELFKTKSLEKLKEIVKDDIVLSKILHQDHCSNHYLNFLPNWAARHFLVAVYSKLGYPLNCKLDPILDSIRQICQYE